jgi:hypothetical protein
MPPTGDFLCFYIHTEYNSGYEGKFKKAGRPWLSEKTSL